MSGLRLAMGPAILWLRHRASAAWALGTQEMPIEQEVFRDCQHLATGARREHCPPGPRAHTGSRTGTAAPTSRPHPSGARTLPGATPGTPATATT
jgi:hypothetical protein